MPATRLILQEQDGNVQVLLHHAGGIIPEPSGPTTTFTNPLTVEELKELRFYLEDYLELPVGVYAETGARVESEGLKVWGEKLFAATFGAEPKRRDAYIRARAEAARGDPVQVLISSNNARFLGLPWELLKDPDDPEPLALKAAGFDRTLPQHDPPLELGIGDELRVLMVIARPQGINDVPYQSIARPLFGQLERVHGKVRVDVLRPPTFAAFRARLAEGGESKQPYHLVHFDGHGTFGAVEADSAPAFETHQFFRAPAPKGYLAFEQTSGESAEFIAAEDFAAALRNARIPLVVLNACRSGTLTGPEDVTGPEASVATRLLQEGTAAVVAMSYSVYVVAAAAFVATFYQEVFRGRSVGQAVAEGRRALRQQNQRPSLKGEMPLEDWMVPVHYTRAEIALAHLATIPEPALAPETFFAELLEEAKPAPTSLAASTQETPKEVPLAPEAGVFVGRDADIYSLERAVRLSHVCVIHGVGGTGKTELAKAFARWLRDTGGLDRENFVFFHSFEPGIASFGLDGVLSAIGLRLFGSEFALKTETSEGRAKLILKALDQYRMLLIWDNFESVASMPEPGQSTPHLDQAAREELKRFVEAVKGTRSALLITSRSPEPWLGEVHRLEVGGLDQHGATAYANFLLAPYPEAQVHRKDDAFKELMDRLEGHPFSMRLVLPHLQHSAAGSMLAGLKGEAELPQRFGSGAGRSASLAVSIEYSFRHLPPADRARLPVLALLEGIGNAVILRQLAEAVPERFTGLDMKGWHELLKRCAALGLLTPAGPRLTPAESLLFRLHPTLPAFLLAIWRAEAGARFDAEREATMRALVTAYAEFSDILLNDIQQGEVALAFGLVAAQTRSLGAFFGAALERRMFAAAQSIMQLLDEYWVARGLALEARAWVDRVREATETAAGTAPLLTSEAGVLWRLAVGIEANHASRAGDLSRAHTAYDAIRVMLEADGSAETRDSLAASYHQLGMVAEQRGQFDAAEAWHRKALTIKESRGDRPGMATSYHQLGMVAYLRGQLDAAETWVRKSLAIKEELGNRPGMATSYHQLGMVAQRRGQLDTADAWYRKAVAISEELGDRLDMAGSYHQLGSLAYLRGQLDAAETWFRKSLAIKEELGNRPGMAGSYHQLGMVAQRRGQLDTADAWYHKAVAVLEELGDRPHMARVYHQLGAVAYLRGQLDAAETWSRESLAIIEELGNRFDMATCYYQLGLVARKRGLLDAAEAWYRKSLAISEELGDRPNLAKSYQQLALVEHARRRDLEALGWWVQAYAVALDTPGDDAPVTLRALASFAADLGLDCVVQTWQAKTGAPMPEEARDRVLDIVREQRGKA